MSERSRTQAAKLNAGTAVAAQLLQMVALFATRAVFVRTLGTEYLGLNGLFLNILGYLNFAELGVAAAITFSLYKPLANKDKAEVAAIVRLLKRFYLGIATFVTVAGFAFAPFVHLLIKGGVDGINVELAFILSVLNVTFSFLYSAKKTLLIADQRGYITNIATSVFTAITQVLQIAILLLYKNFYLYLLVQCVLTLLTNIYISYKADKLYPEIKELEKTKAVGKVSQDNMAYLKKNMIGMVSSKFGGIVVNSTDNILLSFFVGLNAVGIYANYTMLLNGIAGIMNQGLTAVSSSIGNLGATEDPKKQINVFYKYFYASSFINLVAVVGIAAFSSSFIKVWLGDEKFVYGFFPLFIVCVNFYLQNIRQSLITYTNAYGLYWYARYKPIVEAVVNFACGFLLVKYTDWGVSAVLIGTILSNLVINLWWEPYIVIKHAIHTPYPRFMSLYVAYIVLGTVLLGGIAYVVSAHSHDLLSGLLYTVVFEVVAIALFLLVTKLLMPKGQSLDLKSYLRRK